MAVTKMGCNSCKKTMEEVLGCLAGLTTWQRPTILKVLPILYPPSIQKVKATEELPPQAPKPKKPRPAAPSLTSADTSEPRALRKSTMEVSEEFRKRLLEEERRRRRRAVPRVPKVVRKLTQEEMLEEAKRTEIENLVSLEAFARLEAEKKQVKEKKTVLQGPVIRFHSVAMPLITEIQDSGTVENSALQVDDSKTGEEHTQTITSTEMYCRNFLVFTDTKSFPTAYFCSKKPQRPKKQICPITGLPAKYIDPLTGTPYATPQAFKIIRNRYVSEREQKCEKRLLQLSSWLEEKKRKKLEGKII